MKTTAEKSHSSTPSHQQPFFNRNGQAGFFPATSVQPKLTVNTPGDEFEKEADATAERVMKMPASPELEKARGIQRQAEPEEEEVQRQIEPEEEEVQRQAEAKEEEVQRKCSSCGPGEKEPEERIPAETIRRAESNGSASMAAPPIVSETVSGGGQAMETGTRNFMESRFGIDFSEVRVHNDSRANSSAQAISARAYTYGNHIVFASGQYSPHSENGKQLLAHELTHVAQQSKEVRRQVATAAPPVSLRNNTSAQAPPPQARPPEPNAPQPATATASPGLPPAEATPGISAPEATGEQPTAIIEPIMPAPPSSLSPEARERLSQSQANARQNARNNATVPSETESVQEARQGVTEPTQEADARASGALVESLGQRPEPSPEIEELCENILRVIREKRPPDEDSLLQADPEEAAQEAGAQLNSDIESDAGRVGRQYDTLDENPTGEPSQIGQPIESPPQQVGGPEIDAASAAPGPLSPEEVSLDADVAHTSSQMEEAGMNTEPALLVEEGPIAEARTAQGELEQTARESPAQALAQQDEALANARADMAALQANALAALQQSRRGNISDAVTQQGNMVQTEEQMRTSLGQEAERIFTNAQEQVNQLLEPLTRTAMDMWEAGKERIATEFRQHLDRVQRWVDDRHSGFGGGVVELWDDLTGLPDWVTDEYDDAERRFGDSVCSLIREISIYVNGIILTCEQIIDQADQQIAELFANAPESQAQWAAAEAERFRERLNGLRDQALEAQQNFNHDLANRAAEAVEEVRREVHALREAAKGLIGRIADAINDFLEDPIRFIINGLLSLVGIEPARFWALIARIQQVVSDIADDPLGFASNLLSAIGQGFQRFFDNILTHLFSGFIEWLFSAMGAVGVTIPRDLSLSSIITFMLQLMGISWERIRTLLARHIGEENVALIEQAFRIIANLIEMGPVGIFEWIRDKLDPRRILDTIIQVAVDFLVEALIRQVTIRVLALFNPVGAILQAIDAIYRVFKWIFENAARIFSLVETVVNGIADIIAGNIAGMAAAVESALARLVVPVIDFFAGLLHLGDLPEKIAGAIRGLQNWVEGILDTAIGWLATQARGLLRTLGIGGEEGGQTGETGSLEDSEVGETVSFSGGGEQHRLWMASAAGQIEIMVASGNPMPLSEKLRSWESRASGLPEEQRDQAPGLINTVRGQYNIAKEEGEQAQEAIEEARLEATSEAVAEARREDDQAEQAERRMTPELGRLFDIFEGGVPFENVQESINLNGGSLALSITTNTDGSLSTSLDNRNILDQLAEITTGLIARAHHGHGLILHDSIFENVVAQVEIIERINLTDGRIPSPLHTELNGAIQSIKEELGRYRATKVQSLEHLKENSYPPSHQSQNIEIRFNQQLGTSPVIIAEYDRQLGLQQTGINGLSLDQWWLNRNVYRLEDSVFLDLDTNERRAVLNELKRRATTAETKARGKKQNYQNAINEIENALLPENLNDPAFSPSFTDISLVTNRFGNESNWRNKRRTEITAVLADLRTEFTDWDLVFEKAAVLHNADQIAGGFGEIPDISRTAPPSSEADEQAWKDYLDSLKSYVGSSNVNSSIGSLWRINIEQLENHVKPPNYPEESWPVWKMNVTLSR